MLGVKDLFEMRVDFSKQFVYALNYLGQFGLSHRLSSKFSWALFVTLDDFHVLLFFFSGFFQSSFHVLFLLKFLKSLNTDDGLIGEPDFLASVSEQQRRISLILIVLWSVQSANYAYFWTSCQRVFQYSCQFGWPVRNELFWIVLCKWRDHVTQCRKWRIDEFCLIESLVYWVWFLNPFRAC